MVFLACYISSHFVLSRISQGMVRQDWGISDAFIYLPVRPDVVADHEVPLLYFHHALNCFFFPIWKFDEHFLGGPSPMWSMPLRDLAAPSH